MKIQGKMAADVCQFLVKTNKDHDGREVFIDLEVGVKEDEAIDRFGEEFATLAFATMLVREDEDGTQGPTFLQEMIKPAKKRFVFERHLVEIEDQRIEAQPELVGIRTVDGEARVVAKVRLPVDISKTSILSKLMGQVGQTIKTEWNPQQAEFGFEVKPGAKSKAKGAKSAEVEAVEAE